jgi:hypothetical protein
LASTGPSARPGLELALVERQGLAAWMVHGANDPAMGNVSTDQPPRGTGEGGSSQRELIVILADLVLGNRQEGHDERVD